MSIMQLPLPILLFQPPPPLAQLAITIKLLNVGPIQGLGGLADLKVERSLAGNRQAVQNGITHLHTSGSLALLAVLLPLDKGELGLLPAEPAVCEGRAVVGAVGRAHLGGGLTHLDASGGLDVSVVSHFSRSCCRSTKASRNSSQPNSPSAKGAPSSAPSGVLTWTASSLSPV